eukprot:s326_g38.t1
MDIGEMIHFVQRTRTRAQRKASHGGSKGDQKQRTVYFTTSMSTTMDSEGQEKRMHLDLYLELVNDPEDPEWKDAYKERSTRTPDQAMSPVPEDEPSMLSPAAMPSEANLPGERTHARTTKQGSNNEKRQVKCHDCGKILEEEKLVPDERMKSKAKEECDHASKDFLGSTATTWKRTWAQGNRSGATRTVGKISITILRQRIWQATGTPRMNPIWLLALYNMHLAN